jgi:hypothetical protein
MTDQEGTRPHDEELAEPAARAGIRNDTGASGAPAKEEATDPATSTDGALPTDPATSTDGAPPADAAAHAPADAASTPVTEKGPRGSGEEPGYGHLGTSTSGSAGAPEGSADRSRGS